MGSKAHTLAAGAVPLVIAAAAAGIAGATPVTNSTSSTTAPNIATTQPADTAYQSAQLRHVENGPRPMPTRDFLAPIGPLHLPTAVPPVAPIQAPPGTIRVGDIVVGAPAFLNPDQIAQINNTAAGVEAQIATFGDSIGLDPSRSDRAASAIVGDTVIGASVAGSTFGLPLAATGAVIGAINGLVVGLPFAPVGLVIGPIASAAIGAAFSAAPVMLIGGALGAAAGVGQAVFEAAHTPKRS